MSNVTLYSPVQVGVSSFIGGPAAAVYVLRHNFNALGMTLAARHTLVWGAVSCIALMVILPLLPDSFPSSPIPVAYVVLAYSMAKTYAPTPDEGNGDYIAASNWSVLRISIVCLFGSIVVFSVYYLCIELLWPSAPTAVGPVRVG